MKRSKKINPGIKTLAVLLRSGICNKISEMREVKMDITKTLLKRAGVGILTAFVVLLVSAVSWGDTSIYVYQAADSGALTIKAMDCDGNILPPPTQTVPIPHSCYAPDLFWDSASGAVRLNGFDSNNAPSWTGTIDATGKFSTTMSLPLPTINCSSITPPITASVVNAVFPANVPCTSYGAWTACTGGVMTRTVNPQGCTAAQLTTLPCTPACTSWGYSNWTPSSCAAGSIQSRTATGSPAGCVGMPDAATVQSCPPQTCNSFTYQCSGACPTSGTCTAVVTGRSPEGCAGGTPAATISCTPGQVCTDYTYSAWGTCTNASQSRTVTGYTPAGCSGTPATSSVLTQACVPNPVGFTALTFNAGTQTKQDTLTPGQTKYYTYTVPAGITGFSMNISMITQIANLDMVVTQSSTVPTTASLDLYLRDAVAYYNDPLNIGLWSTPYVKKYPPTVWAKMGTDFGGEGIYLKASTKVPAADAAGFAASIPGTYYVAVKNQSTTTSGTYYVYVKQ